MPVSNSTDVLALISQKKLVSLTRRDYVWVFVLEPDTQIVVECLWRLIEAGRVRLTSGDHGQQFGLPAPIDAAAEVNRRIAGQFVKHAELRAGILDLDLHLDGGGILQVIPDSSGYEAWNVQSPLGQYIAAGGGELTLRFAPSTA